VTSRDILRTFHADRGDKYRIVVSVQNRPSRSGPSEHGADFHGPLPVPGEPLAPHQGPTQEAQEVTRSKITP
jgi:hypothetical protein